MDEKENYSTLRLGLDIGVGKKETIFATISNPNEKAHAFVKPGNQVVLMDAWLDTWKREDGTKELQLKAYDSDCQFYLPEVKIPHMNRVVLYGKVEAFADGVATLDIVGNRNPKTNQWTHRSVDVTLGSDYGDPTGKKLMLFGTLGSEEMEGKEGKKVSKLKVNVDYDQLHLMG